MVLMGFQRAIRLVPLLVAKANDPAVSEHEAAAFMSKAKSLMALYNLDWDGILLEGDFSPVVSLPLPDPLSEVITGGAVALCEVVGVKYQVGRTRQALTISVSKLNQWKVAELLEKALVLGRQRLDGSWDGVLLARGYCLGWLEGAAERLCQATGIPVPDHEGTGSLVQYETLHFYRGREDGFAFVGNWLKTHPEMVEKVRSE